jgi:hypothetical protein
MIFEIDRGDFTHVVANEPHPTWDYIQRMVAREDPSYSKESIGPGRKYTMANVLCYKGEPIQYFTMSGEKYGDGVLRCYTSQYVLQKYRSLPGSIGTIATSEGEYTSLSETVNFYDNVWPLISDNFPKYDLFFFSREYGTRRVMERFFKSKLEHPEKWTFGNDRLYHIGKLTDKMGAWKFVNYMGDIKLLSRPSLSTAEFEKRFAGQLTR